MKLIFRFLPFLLLIFFVGLIILLPRMISIKKFNCLNQYGACSQYFLNKIDQFKNQSLVLVKKNLKNFLSSESGISDYSFNYKFPDRLLVNLVEKKAIYALKNNEQNYFAVVGGDGIVIRIQDTTNLPYLITSSKYNVGETISDGEVFALELIYELSTSRNVFVGNLIKDYFTVQLQGPLEVIFPLEGDQSFLITSLNLIIERLNSQPKDSKIEKVKIAKQIDLRYKNPVVTYY